MNSFRTHIKAVVVDLLKIGNPNILLKGRKRSKQEVGA